MNEQTTRNAGWYPDPDNPAAFRFWDGTSWTEHRESRGEDKAQAPSASEIAKPIVCALALGFGAAGAASIIAIPILAFYFPLGLGIAGVAVFLAALTLRGPMPWYGLLALLASVGAIIQGGSAYNDYQDQVHRANQSLQNLQQQLP